MWGNQSQITKNENESEYIYFFNQSELKRFFTYCRVETDYELLVFNTTFNNASVLYKTKKDPQNFDKSLTKITQ